MARETIRLVIDVDGTPRKVFSINQQSNLDLIVGLPAPDFERDIGAPIWSPGTSPRHGRAMSDQRFTIHNSPASEAGLNVFNLHRIFKDGDHLSAHHETYALKRDKKFVLVFGRQVSFPVLPHFDARPAKGTKLSLGSYEPRHFTLFVGLFLGPAGSQFSPPATPNLSFVQHSFASFHAAVGWTFIRLPSTDAG